MNKQPNPNTLADSDFRAVVAVGSSMADAADLTNNVIAKDGIRPKDVMASLRSDSVKHPGSHADGQNNHETANTAFVELGLPDPEALKKAEQAADLWQATDGWHLCPGAVSQGMGACSNPTYGHLLAWLNSHSLGVEIKKLLLDARSHAKQDARMFQGMDETPLRTTVEAWLSAVGGTGGGAMPLLISEDGIRAWAKETGVPVTLILHIFCRGSLPVKDVQTADLNESIFLRHLQAVNSGTYVSALTGNRHPVIDAVFLSSNQNPTGDLPSLDALKAHQAHLDHSFFDMAGGKRVRSGLVDMLDQKADDHGDQRKGVSGGYAALSWDSGRLTVSCAYKAAAIEVQALRAPSDPERDSQEAADLARQLRIVETDGENLLTAILKRSPDLGNEDVVERAKNSFQDRVAGCRGMDAGVVADDSIKAILNSDIPQQYEPLIQKQARAHAQAISDGLHQYQKQTMKDADGLSRCRNVLTLLRQIIDRSTESLMEKDRQLRELAQPHEQIIAEASEQVGELRRRNRLIQWANLRLIGRLAEALQESGQILISCSLQIALCEIAINDVLRPVKEQLDKQLAWLSGMDHKLIQIAQICTTKAERAAEKLPEIDAAPGIQLVTPQYADAFFEDFVARHGGRDRFTDYLLNAFREEHGSLSVLAEASIEECQEAFAAIGRRAIQPEIDNTNVFTEFKKVHPDEATQRKIATRLIRKSESSIRTTGEVNERITWLKIVNAPDEAAAAWLREVLPRSDEKDGVWEVVVTGNRDRIELVQVRGGISLQSLIDRNPISDDAAGWAKLISHAPDPVSALIVPPNPSRRQLRRVLAKAMANGQLTIQPNGSYVLDSSNGQTITLGSSVQSVEEFLQPLWPELVFVESTFGRNLVVAEDKTISALQDLKAKIQTDSAHCDPLLRLIDLPAIEECLTQAELLLPRLRRMRKAAQRRLNG